MVSGSMSLAQEISLSLMLVGMSPLFLLFGHADVGAADGIRTRILRRDGPVLQPVELRQRGWETRSACYARFDRLELSSEGSPTRASEPRRGDFPGSIGSKALT